MNYIRSNRRIIAFFLLSILSAEFLAPFSAFALTGGPSQPEVQSFEPAGTSDLVDVFTGDFTYNIPLMDVGGYPINLAYNANITMDQEASWVGLGWNINPGAIQRNLRGIPDDFSGGEKVTNSMHIKPNLTIGGSFSPGLEVFGFGLAPDVNIGMSYNNYRGVGVDLGLSISKKIDESCTMRDPYNWMNASSSLSIGINLSSQGGLGMSSSLNYDVKKTKLKNGDVLTSSGSGSGSLSFGAQDGLKSVGFGTQAGSSRSVYLSSRSGKSGSASTSHTSLSFASPVYTPPIQTAQYNIGLQLRFKYGPTIMGMAPSGVINGYFSYQKQTTDKLELPAYGYLYEHKVAENEGADSDKRFSVLHDYNREKEGAIQEANPNLPLTNFSYDLFSVTGQGVAGSYRPHRNDIGIVHDNYLPPSSNFSVSASGGLELAFGPTVDTKVGVDLIGVNVTTNSSGPWEDDNILWSMAGFQDRYDANLSLGSGDVDFASKASYEPAYFKQAGEKSVLWTPDEILTSNSDPQKCYYNLTSTDAPIELILDGHSISPSSVQVKGLPPESGGPIITQPSSGARRSQRVRRNQLITTLNAQDAQNFALERTIKSYSLLKDPAPPNNCPPQNDPDYKGYPYQLKDDFRRMDGSRLANHISEFSVLKTDGMRYVYGIPAYNITQKEVTFNVGPTMGILGLSSTNANLRRDGHVTYNPGQDNSLNNDLGIDEFYNAIETPGYAHSYLLTAVLSSDYVDLTGDGPSPDDLGGYQKFNYTKLSNGNTSLYHWRTPVELNSANMQIGARHDPRDNKGSYVYGQKEIWMLHTIITKTHVAEFYLCDRDDSRGVGGENGGTDPTGNTSVALKRLNKIKLFVRNERERMGDKAVPVKTVHFEYDYSLCPKVHNSVTGGGKLTLTGVYFTYDKSSRGEQSKYRFEYTDNDPQTDDNPNYDLRSYDRWGTYKKNLYAEKTQLNSQNLPEPFAFSKNGIMKTPKVTDFVEDPSNNYDKTPTEDFPYTSQVKTVADANAAVWALTKIHLPSGGTIDVNYEADDYAYVQNKRAMQMFKVLAVSRDFNKITEEPNEGTNKDGKELYTEKEDMEDKPDAKSESLYLYIALQDKIDGNLSDETAKALFAQRYLDASMTQEPKMYFRFLVNGRNEGFRQWEYVSGHARVQEYKLIRGKGENQEVYPDPDHWPFRYACIRLEAQSIDDNANGQHRVHPVSLAAWRWFRQNRRELVYPNSTPTNNPAEAIINMFSTLGQFAPLIRGLQHQMRVNGFARYAAVPGVLPDGPDLEDGDDPALDQSFCWVRLLNPNGRKLGGGSRVKKVTITDNWKALTNNASTETDAKYGQEYEYTTTEEIGGEMREISSGVAAYEPQAGADENPFHMPIPISADRVGIPDEISYVDEPYGESFFPAPTVGYRVVRVKDLDRSKNDNNIDGTARSILSPTGYVQHEFYTAKEFPTLVNRSTRNYTRDKTNFLLGLLAGFGVPTYDKITVSQGYSIVTNDMHGKPKASWVFAEPDPNAVVTSDLPLYKQANLISGTKYIYSALPGNGGRNSPLQLNNNVQVVAPDGRIKSATVGREADVVFDTRQQTSIHIGFSLDFNLHTLFIPPFIVIPVPFPVPTISNDFNRFRCAVSTKVVHYSGILSRTEVYDRGAMLASENLLYDQETGEVLLTRRQNEFGDWVYNFTYPSHWMYDGMGPAYKNIGMQLSGVNTDPNGKISNWNNVAGDKLLAAGDEIKVEGRNEKYWITTRTNTQGMRSYYIIDEEGNPLASLNGLTIEVLRSGRRNQTATPAGGIVSMRSPLENNATTLNFAQTDAILNANATEFSDRWGLFCCGVKVPKVECNTIGENAQALKEFLTAPGQYINAQTQTDWQPIPPQPLVVDGTYNADPGKKLIHQLLEHSVNSNPEVKTAVETIPGYSSLSELVKFYKAQWRATRSADNQSVKIELLCVPVILDVHYSAFFAITGLFEPLFWWNQGGANNFIVDVGGNKLPILRCNINLRLSNQADLIPPPNNGPYTMIPDPGFWSGQNDIDFASSAVAAKNGASFYRKQPGGTPEYIENTNSNDAPGLKYDFLLNNVKILGNSQASYTLIGKIDYLPMVNCITQPDNSIEAGEPVLAYDNSGKFTSTSNQFTNPGLTGGLEGTPALAADWNRFNPFPNFREAKSCGYRTFQRINPYRLGLRGNWRPRRAFDFYEDRIEPDWIGAGVNSTQFRPLRRAGVYKTFKPYWANPTNVAGKWTAAAEAENGGRGWVARTRATKFTPTGENIESKDTLGRYSATLLGYDHTLPIATAVNARYREIAFESFEDYLFRAKDGGCVLPRHFGFTTDYPFHIDAIEASHGPNYGAGAFDDANQPELLENSNGYNLHNRRGVGMDQKGRPRVPQNSDHNEINGQTIDNNSWITSDFAHTGRYSLRVPQNRKIRITRLIDVPCITEGSGQTESNDTYIQPGDCIGLFSPIPGQTYVIYGWVKVMNKEPGNVVKLDYTVSPTVTYPNISVAFQGFGSGNDLQISFARPTELIVEGWRQVYCKFTVPQNAAAMVVTYSGQGGGLPGNLSGRTAYFDDIRIQPFNSSMKAFVYDDVNLRVRAELDDRNFATFYEYDEQGNRTRVKKETERGIQTLQENKGHIKSE